MNDAPTDTQARSPRAARTRAALLSAGMTLLAERPVDALAIDEVVALAGVAKGSFFNHFADKQRFAHAVEREIRVEIEAWVAQINADVVDPLERLAGGMIAAAAYAGAKPRHTVIVARTSHGLALDGHPINAGLLGDLRGARAKRLITLPSEAGGVLFWLGCCQALMGSIVEGSGKAGETEHLLLDMLRMGLRGIGAPADRITALAEPSFVKKRTALLTA